MVKVNAPVENFLFPRNQEITNEEIKSKYAILNNLYFQIEKEYNGLGELIDRYNTTLHNRIQQQEDRLKRFLIRKGIRAGISWARWIYLRIIRWLGCFIRFERCR